MSRDGTYHLTKATQLELLTARDIYKNKLTPATMYSAHWYTAADSVFGVDFIGVRLLADVPQVVIPWHFSKLHQCGNDRDHSAAVQRRETLATRISFRTVEL
jgi:hypothetical protein